MTSLEPPHIHERLSKRTSDRLDALETFASVDSTNSYLMSQPAPGPGRCRVAIADQQTSGRGRHSRQWVSPPGSGLYLSLAYTFSNMPAQLPGLTLALGVGVIDALLDVGVSDASLKWPNDIVALDGKLGGILTEVQSQPAAGAVVVSGIGLNLDLPDDVLYGEGSGWAHRAVDVKSIVGDVPATSAIAGSVIEATLAACMEFEASGFEAFADRWRKHDWLLGREVTVDTPERQVTGKAAGVDVDGALVVEINGSRTRIVSGSIVLAGGA